jgi:hypothetical protein
MSSGPAAPRWHGERGFFEIWFVVAIDRRAPRAWWLRYTTFAPGAGAPYGMLWAAAFETGRPARWGKRRVAMDAIHAAVAELAGGRAAGRVDLDDGPIVWELAVHGGEGRARGPAWLDRVPSPTRVAHLRSEADATGIVRVGDSATTVDAVATVKHLWGTRRVEELSWVYCPLLDGGGAFEATGVRVRATRGPAVSPVWLARDGHEHRLWSMPGLFRHRIALEEPAELRVVATSATVRIEAVGSCDPATLAGYVYRDPSGFDVHVAQSDVATCRIEVSTRPHRFASWGGVRSLVGKRAALEVHRLDALPGVRYVPWDGTHPVMVSR